MHRADAWRWRAYEFVRDRLDDLRHAWWWLLGCPGRPGDRSAPLTVYALSQLDGVEVRSWRDEDRLGNVVEVVKGRRYAWRVVADSARRPGNPLGADLHAVDECIAELGRAWRLK